MDQLHLKFFKMNINFFFNDQGELLKYAVTLRKNGLGLSHFLQSLNTKSGLEVKDAFKEMYRLCFDKKGNKTDYFFQIFKKNNV